MTEKKYSSKEVCKICKINSRRLSYLIDLGLVPYWQPSKNKRRLFGFQSLLTIKVIELHASQGMKILAIKENLKNLKGLLGESASLTNTKIIADGKSMYFMKDEETLESLSGSKQLSFVLDIEHYSKEVRDIAVKTQINRYNFNNRISKKRA